MRTNRFDGMLYVAAGVFVVALLFAVMAGVVSRGLGNPYTWTEEVSGFLMVWLVCLGWMIATRRNAHIRIRFFQDKLPGRSFRVSEGIIQLSIAMLGTVVAWQSIHLIQVNSDIEAVTLPISTAWMYVPLLPAGVVTCAQALTDLYKQVRGVPATGMQTP